MSLLLSMNKNNDRVQLLREIATYLTFCFYSLKLNFAKFQYDIGTK